MTVAQRVYTVSQLGAVVLFAALLGLLTALVGGLLSVEGITAGGLALFGGAFTVGVLIGDTEP